jgi:NADH-quinone oxidoreductase subunit A
LIGSGREERKTPMVLFNYIFIGLLLLVAILFALAPLWIEFLVAPRKRTLAKGDAYECGVKTYGETWVRFRIQYYIYALMFVVFDIETVFLFPWAASFADLKPVLWRGIPVSFTLIEMFIFLVILFVGLVYAWAKGVLRWV